MKILIQWPRTYLPTLHATNRELADVLTLPGVAQSIFNVDYS